MNRENNVDFWKKLIIELSEIDYGDNIPELTDSFLEIWSNHYYLISKTVLPDSDFLEIGTGFGVLATGISRLSRQSCFTTEHPSRSYFKSKSYIDFLTNNSVFITGSDLREGLPFKTESFSVIYLCDVIEHLFFHDIKTLLTEIVRVLKPEGKLIISTPNLNRLGNLIRIMCGYSPNPPLYVESCGKTFGHIREFAPKELYRILSVHGLKTKSSVFGLNPSFSSEAFGAENIFSQNQSQWIHRINRIISIIFPMLKDEIYLLAQKDGHIIGT
ncbi:MAG: methyltransferase domain-containing protein [Desulfamplus sp.]|nr:methyltransferase domain-containing protein [Desulfamplus sp.]